MKQLYILLIATLILTLTACNKETPSTQTEVMSEMLANKTWYLDYMGNGTLSKSYVGQSTYFVTFLKDGSIKDSDGLTGTYTIELKDNQSQIHVQVKTANGNPLEVVYTIISIGDNKLVLAKNVLSVNPTSLYFTSK